MYDEGPLVNICKSRFLTQDTCGIKIELSKKSSRQQTLKFPFSLFAKFLLIPLSFFYHQTSQNVLCRETVSELNRNGKSR